MSFFFKVGSYAPSHYRLRNRYSNNYYMSRGRTTITIGQTHGQVTQTITPGRYDIYYSPRYRQIRIRHAN